MNVKTVFKPTLLKVITAIILFVGWMSFQFICQPAVITRGSALAGGPGIYPCGFLSRTFYEKGRWLWEVDFMPSKLFYLIIFYGLSSLLVSLVLNTSFALVIPDLIRNPMGS